MGLLAIPMFLSFCSSSKENPGSGALGRWQLERNGKNCGAWASGLELAAGWAVVGEGSTLEQWAICRHAVKVCMCRQCGGCERPGCKCLSLSWGSAEALT